ncbi:putative CoA dehydratase subunit/(R)-2-hydroxyglutaryl-CoA dehydratase activator [Carboxydothermus hydrogenoformans Z-2901]|uniref:Putative CoA dehydratase subunit/(R)-2-hydroxyglutaryl-CoA dehydratase activator n=1 Tax=Carboxydothermus hydrogenoformans (strain ATCC BAA-161 / DSM 6008 / Z-2901) TaxID=246194 RepID=Q3ACV4_CARHZ|nr:putative CoA dehydratase subunit/(R)-2-hydroxyglutaryl-CoA dehydratase activator [Carboxydothermus hydrogenoformans Z-2901]
MPVGGENLVGYVCKYTPVEIIEAFGEKPVRIESGCKSYERAEALLHTNTCSFVKGVLENIIENNIEEVILTSCCDSIKRLYDVLKERLKFIYILDLPRKKDTFAVDVFYKEIIKFIDAYKAFKNKGFAIENFLKILEDKSSFRKMQEPSESIAILGARLKDDVVEKIKNSCSVNIINFTCTGEDRIFNIESEDNLLKGYAASLLNLTPCMRMAEDRSKFFNKDFKGIIYNTIKFCDYYSYEYAEMKSQFNIPFLKIETDYTDSNSGQILTRIAAFFEATDIKKMEQKKAKKGYFAGIDSGSTSTNVVIIDENKNIISYSIIPTGPKALESAFKAFEIALNNAGIKEKDITSIVATGYGRVSIPFADKMVTEITCHGKGAFFIDNRVRTVIDIGGQDSKVIRLDESGNVIDFVMNDKCSAGTGRFLEVMSRTLGISINEMAKVHAEVKENITITSMCTVFAESEVISLIAQNKDQRDIIHALNKSVASKAVSLVDRIGRKGKYMMTGGVAKNQGVVSAIESKLGEKLVIPAEPQIIGALGAALIAFEGTNG